MPMGIAMSQKMQVTGGLEGNFGRGRTFSSTSGVALLTLDPGQLIRFFWVAVIFLIVSGDRLFQGIEITMDVAGAGLRVVDRSLGGFRGGRTGEMGGGLWPNLVLLEVEFLYDEGGVGGGEGNLGLGDKLDDNSHSSFGRKMFCSSFSFLSVAFLPLVVLSISTSSKVRRAPKSVRASIATVTLPWAIICARYSKEAEVLEGSITVMAPELQQEVEGSVRLRRGEQARRRAASTWTPWPPSPGRRSMGW